MIVNLSRRGALPLMVKVVRRRRMDPATREVVRRGRRRQRWRTRVRQRVGLPFIIVGLRVPLPGGRTLFLVV
jgi:hypothetical protein